MQADCPSCAKPVPADASFCPHCGTRLAEGTEVPQAGAEDLRVFGAPPPTALLVLAAAALGASVVLLAVGRVLAAGVLLAVAVALGAGAARLLLRNRHSPLAVRAASAADRGRGRLEIVRAGAEARRRAARLRAERERLLGDRRARLAALGEAVYGDDGEATSRLRAEVEKLDAAIAAKEAEMESVARQAQERVAQTRLETDPTRIVPAAVTEPFPPPGEADPPEPARVPEPYPPPGEADPPEPPRIPEPYPDPGEADPPEPARVPEPGPDGHSH